MFIVRNTPFQQSSIGAACGPSGAEIGRWLWQIVPLLRSLASTVKDGTMNMALLTELERRHRGRISHIQMSSRSAICHLPSPGKRLSCFHTLT
jgi:hypothetical protein